MAPYKLVIDSYEGIGLPEWVMPDANPDYKQIAGHAERLKLFPLSPPPLQPPSPAWPEGVPFDPFKAPSWMYDHHDSSYSYEPVEDGSPKGTKGKHRIKRKPPPSSPPAVPHPGFPPPITAMEVLLIRDLPTWPLPPPSPPFPPPSPPPLRLLAGSSRLECNFEVGVDLSIVGVPLGSENAMVTNHRTDTRMQCCGLCAMRQDCHNFIFMAESGICSTLPLVEDYQLVRSPNPATTAGTVFVSHAQEEDDAPGMHAKCGYDVGQAWARGILGVAKPRVGQRMSSQQVCDPAPLRMLRLSNYICYSRASQSVQWIS